MQLSRDHTDSENPILSSWSFSQRGTHVDIVDSHVNINSLLLKLKRISPVLLGGLLSLFWYCNCYSVFIPIPTTSLQPRIFMPRGSWHFASLEASYRNNVEILDIHGTDWDSPCSLSILNNTEVFYWQCFLLSGVKASHIYWFTIAFGPF